MPKPRFSGGSRSMRFSSREIVPPVTGSSPAMQLSAVVLPQPDGPSRQMNSPRRMVSVISCSAATCAPPGCPKWRETRSRRSSLKFEFILERSNTLRRQPEGRAKRARMCRHPLRARACARAPRDDGSKLFRLRCADLLIPDAESIDHLLGIEWLGVREFRDPAVIFRPAEFLDHVLALLRRHRDWDVLHCRPGIEITLVVGHC